MSTVACPNGHQRADPDWCDMCDAKIAGASAPVESSIGWVAVIEVDQQWFQLRGALADQPCPSPSSSTVPLANHTSLIGRSSAARGVRPELSLDADTGVSRRHAQFVRDGDNLTIVDLSSTNGTYVVGVAGSPESDTPALVPGVPTELYDGDRIYVGAWSRLTVRSTPA